VKRLGIRSDDAPAPVGPYSQAVRDGDTLYMAGQVPLDPATGKLIEGSIADETAQVLRNLEAVLVAAGGSPASVVRTTIYLTDLGDFARVNEVYADFFSFEPAPARSTVQVAALPLGARIEIDAIAALH